MTTVYGNPRKMLAFLDDRRLEILLQVPIDVDDIPDALVTEWIALLRAREKVFAGLIKQDAEALFDQQILRLRDILAEMCANTAAYRDDPIQTSLHSVRRQVQKLLQRKDLCGVAAVSPTTTSTAAQTADAAVQTDTERSPEKLVTPTCDAQSGNDVSMTQLQVEPKFVWLPGATSTPLQNKAMPNNEERFSPVAASTPLIKPQISPRSRSTKSPKSGVKLDFEVEHLTAKQPHLPEENSLLDVANHSLQRSFSVPERLDQQTSSSSFASTYFSAASGRSSVSGMRSVTTLASYLPNAQPFARHLNAFAWKPAVLPVIAQEPSYSAANKSDHNDSVD